MQRIKIMAFIVVAIMLTSCARSSGITYTPPALEGDWVVRMRWSGGVAGLPRNMEVNSDGSYTVTDERTGATTEGKLTADELASLEELVSTLEFSAPETPSGCADCFVYDVEIESGGRKMTINADDVSLGDSGMGPLVQFLRGIMDASSK